MEVCGCNDPEPWDECRFRPVHAWHHDGGNPPLAACDGGGKHSGDMAERSVESKLSKEDVFDTPRPAGAGLALTDFVAAPASSGYDFSAFSVVPWDNPNVDIYFGYDGAVYRMIAPFTDTDIQDAGYTASLDDVDYAPLSGWSRDGKVELIEGHSYIVRTTNSIETHYAKFRVVALSASPARVIVDWAYQIDPDNRELGAHPARREGARVRRPVAGLR